jgi:hypothetical protein
VICPAATDADIQMIATAPTSLKTGKLFTMRASGTYAD